MIVRKGELNPSNNKHEHLYSQFVFRNTGIYNGESEVVIMDTKEPIWWNRPLETDTFCKLEDDGIYSYNLKYCGAKDNIHTFKTNYNFFLGNYSITYISLIHLDNLSQKQIDDLLAFPRQTMFNSLVELGVDKDRLTLVHNDILFDGKKFFGEESMIDNNVLCEAYCCTLNFTKEKDIFSRLTGKYNKVDKICGISEYYPQITKELLIETIYKNSKDFYNNLGE